RGDRVAQRPYGQRLRQPRDALEQHVPAGQEADEHALDHVRLADDDLSDLGLDAVHERALARDDLVELTGVYHRAGSYHERGCARAPAVRPKPAEERGNSSEMTWAYRPGSSG